MKVITENDKDLDLDSIYYIRAGDHAGIITYTGFFQEHNSRRNGKFVVRLFDALTRGNSFVDVEFELLEEIIKNLRERGVTIIAFDSIEDVMVHHLAKYCHKIDPHDDSAITEFFALINGV